MLGYTYSTGTITQSPSLNTYNQFVYSPSTGVTGNFLTPGNYTASIYSAIYVDTASASTTSVSFGIISNSSTNPAGGSSAATPISLGVQLNNTAYSIASFFPTFTFTVTTSGYYYSYMNASGGSLSGTYVILTRLLSIVRVG